MTDNEIVKALECCSTYKGKCTDCPAFVKVDRSNCKQVLLGAIEIINRQKAEIEKLNKELQVTRQYIHDNGLEWDLLSKSKKQKCDCYHTETKRRYTYNPITGDPIGHDIM